MAEEVILLGGGIRKTRDLKEGAYTIQNSVITVFNPIGGTNSFGSVTGAIKIALPVLWTNSFVKIIVDVYDFNRSFKVEIEGYNNTVGPNFWVTPFASIYSSENNDLKIRFGYDASKACVWVGELATSWNNPRVVIRCVEASRSAFDNRWAEGWVITIPNTFDTVQTTLENNFPIPKYSSGVTGSRPTGIRIGFMYFDTTLTKPIWWTGTVWVDATGTTV